MRKAIQSKIKRVDDLKVMIRKYPVAGLVDITNLPTKQFHEIKKKLSPSVFVTIEKKHIINKALEQLKDERAGIEKLAEHTGDIIPAILLSELDSFKLMKKIRMS